MLGGNLRRSARLGLVALAASSALLAAIAPTAGAADEPDDVAKPEVFAGDAASLGVSINVDNSLLPVPNLFQFIALDGNSTYSSSKQAARASILFPGNGAILGPSLLCGTFGGMFPPQFKPILDTCLQYQYPLTVFADSFKPDSSTTGSVALGKPTDDISAGAASAKAHAAEDSSTSDAVVSDLRVLGVPPVGPVALPGSKQLKLDTSIVDIDSATSRTRQRVERGVLVTTASATLSGIKLAGGLIRIGSLKSVSTISDDGRGERTAAADLDISGVTVAGVPARITNKGLVLGSTDGGGSPVPSALTAAANRLLKSFDTKLTTLPTVENKNDNGRATASAGGVLLELTRNVQSLPQIPSPLGELDPNGTYKLIVQLGSTGTVGSAANFGADEALTDDVLGAVDELGDDGFFDDSGSFDDGSDFDAIGDDSALGSGRTPANDSGDGTLVRRVADRFGGRLGFLYLALMFTVLALCITPRLAVPARLPGIKR